MLLRHNAIFPRARSVAFALLASAAVLPPLAGFEAARAVETVLYTFTGRGDGSNPFGALISDTHGALYGVTKFGGSLGHGAVYKLTPPTAGKMQWTESVLYSFTGGADGNGPLTGLVFDTQGALYGTTWHGGASNHGVVFKLTPPAAGHTQWTESVLYTFTGGADGGCPYGQLIFDTQGALYGTASSYPGGDDGVYGNGSVFKLTPPASGAAPWTITVLYEFAGKPDGANPISPLIFDTQGALYGATYIGGTANAGTVFKLTRPLTGTGPWNETVLHSFNGGTDGFGVGGLTFDHQGALYGMTLPMSADKTKTSTSVVFKLTPPEAKQTQWTESLIYTFPKGVGGASGTLISDTQGALYGTTFALTGGGAAFKLTAPTSGTGPWSETVLYNFAGNNFAGNEAANPYGGLLFGPGGVLYGTTNGGGTSGKGLVFQLSHPSCP